MKAGDRDIDKKRKTDMLKNTSPINITADDREHKSEVIKSLTGIDSVEVCIQRLSIGDYQVDNRVIVERKTLKATLNRSF